MINHPYYKEMFNWLLEPVTFARNLIKVDGNTIIFDDWQKEFLRDNSKFSCLLKSRRVGGSWALALKMFMRSQLRRNYSGTFVSLNMEEAKGKIEYADAMYESLPKRFRKKRVTRSRTELVFEDAKGNRSVLRSLASKAPRGQGGDVGISELPHCRDAEEIYYGALHVTSRSVEHSLAIESTPLGKKGIFYDIAMGRYKQFNIFNVPWWESKALCVNPIRAKEAAPKLATAKRVESFGTPSLRAIYQSLPANIFKQESELEFVDSSSSAFPVELLQKNSVPDFGVSSGLTLKYLSVNSIPLDSHWQWLKENIKGRAVAGFDVGRKKDESVLVVMDEIDSRFETRMLVRLKDIKFSAQEEIIALAIKSGVRRLAIDSTGIGLQLSEKTQDVHGEIVLPVHFTSNIKSRMINDFRMLLLDTRLRLPLEKSVISQLSSIEQKITDSGNIIFTIPYASDNHADIAWSILLACHARRETGESKIIYETVSVRGNQFENPITKGWRW